VTTVSPGKVRLLRPIADREPGEDMDEERVGIELIVSVIAWFAVVLLAFFFVGAVVGVIAILLGALLFIWWLVRAIRAPEKGQ
jgi:Flp pilus assembly protein TadB